MILRVLIDLFLVIGFIFAVAGTKGVLQMPDTFCRMQASTCITTLGTLGVVALWYLGVFLFRNKISKIFIFSIEKQPK